MWIAEERPITITFTPMDVDYNYIRLHSIPCSLYLTRPDSRGETNRYLIALPASALTSGVTPIGHHGGTR